MRSYRPIVAIIVLLLLASCASAEHAPPAGFPTWRSDGQIGLEVKGGLGTSDKMLACTYNARAKAITCVDAFELAFYTKLTGN